MPRILDPTLPLLTRAQCHIDGLARCWRAWTPALFPCRQPTADDVELALEALVGALCLWLRDLDRRLGRPHQGIAASRLAKLRRAAGARASRYGLDLPTWQAYVTLIELDAAWQLEPDIEALRALLFLAGMRLGASAACQGFILEAVEQVFDMTLLDQLSGEHRALASGVELW